MENNNKEINNVCKHCNVFLNKDNVYQFKNSNETIGNLGILPVKAAKKVLTMHLCSILPEKLTEASFINSNIANNSTIRSNIVEKLDKNMKKANAKEKLYNKFYRQNPTCFVFTELSKLQQDKLPTAKDFSHAIYNYENEQLKALNELNRKARNILSNAYHKLFSMDKNSPKAIRTASCQVGLLACKLAICCNHYVTKYQDNSITGEQYLRREMVKPAIQAKHDLAVKIGKFDMHNQGITAMNYDFVVNHCSQDGDYRTSDYVQKVSKSGKLGLLNPITIVYAAHLVSYETQKRSKCITDHIFELIHLV